MKCQIYIKLILNRYTRVTNKALNIPGHFFNIEHSPYLFPMFSFKKHRSMYVCNPVTKVTKINGQVV
jgi:hypothetical protein